MGTEENKEGTAKEEKPDNTDLEREEELDTVAGGETVPKTEFLRRLSAKNRTIVEARNRATSAENARVAAEKRAVEGETHRIAAEKARAELAAMVSDAAARRTLATAGVTDPEAQDLVTHRWRALPEATRGDLEAYVAPGAPARTDRFLSHLWTTEQKGQKSAARVAPGDRSRGTSGREAGQGAGDEDALSSEAIAAMTSDERRARHVEIMRSVGFTARLRPAVSKPS